MKRFRRWLTTGLVAMFALYIVVESVRRPQQVPGLTIDDLSFSLTAAAGTDVTIPRSISQLDGCTVEIAGDFRGGTSPGKFALTDWSHFHSYMPRPPLAQEFVNVQMNRGSEASGFSDRMLVHGTLHVKLEKQDGRIASIYRLDADWAKPFPS